jgi:hypothetical protein
VSFIDDLIAIEDKAFIDAIDEIVTFQKAMEERRRWRDGRRIVHILVPIAGVELGSGKQRIIGWTVRCGYKRRSDVEHDPESIPTCIRCIGERNASG